MNPAEQVLQYHIQLGRDVPLGKYCLLPGDPASAVLPLSSPWRS